MVLCLSNHTEWDGFLDHLLRGFSLFNLSFVVRNHSVLVVEDDIFVFSVSLDHLLVMAATLDGISALDCLGHQRENSFLASHILVFKLLKMFLDEGDVFDGLIEIPHS